MADKIELVISTLNEFSTTSRTMLGLSSGGIGLLVSLFREPPSGRWAIVLSLCCFLLSIMSWLYFSLHSIRLRQDMASANATNWTVQSDRDVISKLERGLLKAFTFQQRTFVFGVLIASITVIVGMARSR